jgi:uncharacterized protein (DUF924 family)
MSNDPRAEEVLEYWFGARGGEEWGKFRPQWFRGGKQADDDIRTRFAELHAEASRGELDDWLQSAEGSLALIIVLDQFSRNLHRGTAGAFAADAKALALAKRAIALGFDQAVLPVQRWFFYLPFEHAEDVEEQRRAVELFSALPDDEGKQMGVDYAKQHLDIIERFGRFPHRNAMLGRDATPEEAKWLAEGGATFG